MDLLFGIVSGILTFFVIEVGRWLFASRHGVGAWLGLTSQKGPSILFPLRINT